MNQTFVPNQRAQCQICHIILNGFWEMEYSRNKSERKRGRLLGITDGYFLNNESPNWVYCYCFDCWKRAMLTLDFVQENLQEQIRPLQDEIISQKNQHLNQVGKLEQSNQKLEQEVKDLQSQINVCQQSNTLLEEKINEFERQTKELDNFFRYFSLKFQNTDKTPPIYNELSTDQQNDIKDKFDMKMYTDQLSTKITNIVQEWLEEIKQKILVVAEEVQNEIQCQFDESNKLEQSIILMFSNASVSFLDDDIQKAIQPTRAKKELCDIKLKSWLDYTQKMQVKS